MDFLNLALVSKPTGLWPNIIFGLDGIGGYIVAIILVTIFIRLFLLPFEFVQRKMTKTMSTVNARLQPKMDAIKKQYANNPQMMNQKMSELQRKEGGALYGSCFGMLAYMVINLVIFFTFCGSMNDISKYMISKQYTELSQTYDIVYETALNGSEDEADIAQAKNDAQDAVLEQYDDSQESFLWIKSIWRPDNNSSPVLSYKDYLSSSGTKEADLSKERYETVMGKVISTYEKTWNGYFVLPILSAVLMFLSTKSATWVSKWRAKRKNQVYVNPADNKMMNFIMPVIMALFTLFYNAGFAIYIVAGSIVSLLTTPLMTLLIEYIADKQKDKHAPATVSYSRENLKK